MDESMQTFGKATLMDMDHGHESGGGVAWHKVYHVEPPMAGEGSGAGQMFDYVVVSAAMVFGAPETYIFGSNAEGEVQSWSELPGSFRGDLDHEGALLLAGYLVVDGEWSREGSESEAEEGGGEDE